MTDGAARLGVLCCLGLLVSGCAVTWLAPTEGLIWHHSRSFAVPDLGAEGWERVGVEDADVAFQSVRGVIAIRAECDGAKGPPHGRARDLWLGIERTELERSERSVGSYPAYETLARAKDVMVRTIVFRTPRCWVDVAHVAPIERDDPQVLDQFVARIRFGDAAGGDGA